MKRSENLNGGQVTPRQVEPHTDARGAKWELLRGRGWALALGVSLAMLFAWSSYAPLFNPDEGRYTSASLEMARGFEGRAPDWIVPHLNGVPRLNKPPLVYWCMAGAMRILGPTELAGRLPSMLAAALVALLLWHWGRRAVDEMTGRIAALVWLSGAFPFAFARIGNTDMLLAAALALATFGVWMAIDGGFYDEPEPHPKRRADHPRIAHEVSGALLAGVGMGLALLAKGPVGAVFPLATGLAALVASGRWRVLGSARVWAALAVALGLAGTMAGGWVAAVSARAPGFLHRFIVEENLGRMAGEVKSHAPAPIWLYVPIVLLGLLPWSAFLLSAMPARSQRERRALWFWGAYAVIIIAVFSLSKTKLASYVLPAFAPLSLLLGLFFAARIQSEQNEQELSSEIPAGASRSRARLWRASLWISLVMQALLVTVGSYFLLSDRVVPRAEGLPIVLALGVAQAVGVTGIIRALSASKAPASKRGAGAGAVFGWAWAGAALLHLALLFGASRVALYEDSGSIMRELSPHLRADDSIVLWKEFQPSAIFYARRPVFLVDFSNTSGLDQAAIDASKYFPRSRVGMLERWRVGRGRVFVLCNSKLPDMSELRRSWIVVARTNDHYLFCNRDAPRGFRHDFVAPRKQER